MSKYLCADCVSKEQCNGEWTTNCASYVPKEHKQTNEEWLRSATTEHLAEFLFGIAYMCSYCGDEAHSSQEKMQQCHFGKCGCRKKDWKKWLKQPHHEKE